VSAGTGIDEASARLAGRDLILVVPVGTDPPAARERPASFQVAGCAGYVLRAGATAGRTPQEAR
jgi:hypothetical protein